MSHTLLSPALTTHVLTMFPGGRYSAPCRSCGTRLRLTDDDLEQGLDEAPICWPCDTGSSSAG